MGQGLFWTLEFSIWLEGTGVIAQPMLQSYFNNKIAKPIAFIISFFFFFFLDIYRPVSH